MSEKLYEFFFEVTKEINRSSEEVYSTLENKISTLIATNTIVISIVLGLGNILVQNIGNVDIGASQTLSLLISFSIISFAVSLFISFVAFKTKKYKMLNPYKLIEENKNEDELAAKETITDTLASAIKDNLKKYNDKAKFIDYALISLFIGVIFIIISTIFLFYSIYFVTA